jgi:hypothetical protein
MNDLSRPRPIEVAGPCRPWLSRVNCPCHDGTEPPIATDAGKEALPGVFASADVIEPRGTLDGRWKSRGAPLVFLGHELSRIGLRANRLGR